MWLSRIGRQARVRMHSLTRYVSPALRRGRSDFGGAGYETLGMGYGHFRRLAARYRGRTGQRGHQKSLRHRSQVRHISGALFVHRFRFGGTLTRDHLRLFSSLAGDLSSVRGDLHLEWSPPDPRPAGQKLLRIFDKVDDPTNEYLAVRRGERRFHINISFQPANAPC